MQKLGIKYMLKLLVRNIHAIGFSSEYKNKYNDYYIMTEIFPAVI